MPYRAHYRSLAVAMAFTLVVTLALFIPSVSANDGDDVVVPPKPAQTYPNLSTHLNHLSEGYGSGRMSQGEAASEAPVSSGGSVAVTVYLDGHVSDVVAFLEANGGDVRNVGEDYIEAYVPVFLLGSLSQQPGVTRVLEIIPPQPAYGNVTSQAVALHLADSWQDAGYQGQGVKVGVIDVGFVGYRSLMGVELPDSVVARCYTDVGVYTSNLADCEESEPLPDFKQCSRGESGSVHGTAVAEAVIDIAPDAILYISQPGSWGDLQSATEWMANEGVTVINYSVGWTYSGPGDGTSPFSSSPLNTVDLAVARDIIWANSAGNSAEDTWFGSFSDHNGDGAMSFNSAGEEINSIDLRECRRYAFQMRWHDSWGGAATDLDMYLWDKSTGDIWDIPREWGYIGSAVGQSGASDDYPFEYFSLRSPVTSSDVGLVIVHVSGPVPNWVQVELWSGPGGLGIFTGNGSIGNPAESANPGLLAVGAAPFFDISTIEFFSSRGPTPDGRIKPEIVGIDCAASVSYELDDFRGNACWFPGTSQASPHVAGMAALVRQRFPDFTAEETAAYLKDHAEPRGAVPNNTWGYGLAQLPAADVGGCLHELDPDGPTTGQWSPQCQSFAFERGYAQYYRFTLEEDSQVTIALDSVVDPYLFLRAGDARSGDYLHVNDDIEAGVDLNSRLTAPLAAGTYTIEATTYDMGETGDFTLTISGLGGDGVTGATPDGCGQTIISDVTTSGAWAAGCQSAVPDRGYARYYTFTLDQPSQVTIDLQSSVDTYLYLRRGTARTGEAEDEDDDVTPGSNTNSRISLFLDAGIYTIEATTYAQNLTGSFMLTVTGLGGTATGPGPGTDPCVAELPAGPTVDGSWAAGCQSAETDRGYARYYTFTTTEARDVTITLSSTVDPYLYLRSGDRTGSVRAQNDDHGTLVDDTPACGSPAGLGDRDSCITIAGLSPGTYTIEATTYDEGVTGDFTLTISGLSGAATGTDPEPGTDTCAPSPIYSDGVSSGTWADDCQSQDRSGRYARYFTFTLAQQATVTIDLVSSVDPFLFLREGDARSGSTPHVNDDVEAGVNLNSRISASLAAGTWTIEATTYAENQAGDFTLTISGLSGETTAPDPGTDPCAATPIEADGGTTGDWAADCQSQQRSGRYARYYAFTLAQQSAVTITLESDVDTYLYLWEGEVRSGEAKYENDDIAQGGVNLNSRISETLAARTYTIEATTYHANEVGTFTLTVAGLGEGGTSTGG